MFELAKDGWEDVFNPEKLDNHKLLWHGTRYTNVADILFNSLRIAPPEAPKTGYLFGKGAYFADCCCKSSFYTHSHLSNGVGFFLLCQVALGTEAERTRCDPDVDDYVKKAGNKVNSCHAVGQRVPDHSKRVDVKRKDGHQYEVPLGPIVHNPAGAMGYNEFIVYERKQIMMRYLVKVKIN